MDYFSPLIFLLHLVQFLFVSFCLSASLSLLVAASASDCLPLPLPPSCAPALSLSLASLPRGTSGPAYNRKGLCNYICSLHTALQRRIHLFSHAPVRHRGRMSNGGRDKRYFIVTLFFRLHLEAPRQVLLNIPAVLSAVPKRNHFSLACPSAELSSLH